jgi:hypothetical protein
MKPFNKSRSDREREEQPGMVTPRPAPEPRPAVSPEPVLEPSDPRWRAELCGVWPCGDKRNHSGPHNRSRKVKG